MFISFNSSSVISPSELILKDDISDVTEPTELILRDDISDVIEPSELLSGDDIFKLNNLILFPPLCAIPPTSVVDSINSACCVSL